MGTSNLMMVLPSYHSCGMELVKRKIKVIPEILMNPYPVDYCPNCEIYKFNEIESKNPNDIAKHVEGLQLKTDEENRRKGLIQ